MTRRSPFKVACSLTLGVIAISSSACIEFVRVPLAVPVSAVGGARPAAPSGLFLVSEFGDGVWGQEQERAEMGGVGIGVAALDRIEGSLTSSWSTRTVNGSDGAKHHGAQTEAFRVKVRVADFWHTRGAVGIQLARSSAVRESGSQQSDVLSALDVAVPVEIYRMNGPLAGHRFGLYVAPRAVFQTFEDQRPGATPGQTKGTMFGALVGLSARWRYVALSGEVNVMKTPVMRFEDASFGGGTHLLPAGAVRLIWPLGG